MKSTGKFTDVDTNAQARNPELQVRIDRDRAADQGVDVRGIATALGLLVGGEPVTQVQGGSRPVRRVAARRPQEPRPAGRDRGVVRARRRRGAGRAAHARRRRRRTGTGDHRAAHPPAADRHPVQPRAGRRARQRAAGGRGVRQDARHAAGVPLRVPRRGQADGRFERRTSCSRSCSPSSSCT